MGFIEGLLEWSRTTFLPFGELGLFVVAFMESSFFPIPPDIILIPLVLLKPELGLWFATICVVGSVLGSILGYYIGSKGGRPLLKKLISKKRFKKVESYFSKYGLWAVGIAAFSPIPYKIFTIASGVFKFSMLKMILVSIIGRGGRFYIEAAVLMIWGKEIVGFFESYFEIATIVVIGIIILLYVIYKKILNH